jgi:hypothetical protein
MNKETESKELKTILSNKELEEVFLRGSPEKAEVLGLILEDIVHEGELRNKINGEEDMDLSAGYERELKRTTRYLKKEFRQAVKLGLGDLEYIRERYKKYVGKELSN